MEGLLFLALIAFGVWHYWGKRYLQVNRAKNALQRLGGFSATFSLVGTDGATVALDAVARKIAFVDRAGNPSIYMFKEIIAVEACKNGTSFSKTNRGSQIVTAAIGHLLFGTKGFVVGGTTGSSTTSERVTALSIKIYLTDLAQPVREIGFYKGPAIEMRSRRFQQSVAILDEWYGRLRIAIAKP
ncbi:hypothetical protein [Bradyrhizobium yuanmingense]